MYAETSSDFSSGYKHWIQLITQSKLEAINSGMRIRLESFEWNSPPYLVSFFINISKPFISAFVLLPRYYVAAKYKMIRREDKCTCLYARLDKNLRLKRSFSLCVCVSSANNELIFFFLSFGEAVGVNQQLKWKLLSLFC